MSKLIMWNLMTLDGYFEGNQNWDLTFHSFVWGQELEKLSIEQLHSADYLVFGRVTYEGIAAYWTKEEGEIDDLYDEYRIGIAPVILGSGRPLFRQGISSKNLSLVSTQQLLTGGLILKYTN